MSFLYPLFLIAGLSLAIPTIIHLFNLRRYKTILFPHTRFLKNIQLVSRKQSELKYRWLLACRLLFLASLIIAFAQPFFNKTPNENNGNSLQVIYIDNSFSMSVKKGQRSLLDMAKEAALTQIRHSGVNNKYLLLTNDKPQSYRPLTSDKIASAINDVEISPAHKNEKQVLGAVQSLAQIEGNKDAALYYYSDFQKSSFDATPDPVLIRHINFTGIPVLADAFQNVYIDTAYINSPVLQEGQNEQLIVRTKYSGSAPKQSPVLQLSVNGQMKSAATVSFPGNNESIDTLNFAVSAAGMQKLELTLNDAVVKFDDTFRIGGHSATNLSILVINEKQANPYIQAAFKAYNGFKLTQATVSNSPKDWQSYNLIILNDVTHIDASLGKTIQTALQQGISICLVPGKTYNTAALNEGLKQVEDIQIAGIDTTTQTTSSLQQGSDLVKGLFEKIPDNVQLPTANWHYIIHSSLSANGQSIISFRNGDPFLAAYKPSKGILYVTASSADMGAGNFPGSYFFAPFLFQMAMQSHSSDIYALTSGAQQSAYLPLKNTEERNTIHLYGNGIDMIPVQRPEGAGVNVYVDQSIQQPGFYLLSAKGSDTTVIALNADRKESIADVWGINDLREQWKGEHISWQNISDSGSFKAKDNNGFPLWKVCVILALIMLAAESFLLASGIKKQTVATQ